MDKKELKTYLNNTVFFGVKDFEKTNNKYKNYLKYIDISLYEDVIISELKTEDFYSLPHQNQYYTILIERLKEVKTKHSIRELATYINQMFFNILQANMVHYYNTVNENQKISLASRFYMKNYNQVNKIMTKLLKEFTLDL